MHMRLILPVLLSFAVLPAFAESRTFVDSSGRLIKGELVSVSGEMVTIKREDGQSFTLKVSTFCPRDIEYFKEHSLPSSQIKTNETNAAEKRPRPTLGGQNLLTRDHEQKWKTVKGAWKIENNTLTGEGDSATEYHETVSPPFTLNFEITVLKGMRPRITLGPITCNNEGFETTLALYPPGRDAGFFHYDRNKPYRVSLVATRNDVQMFVDDKLIATGPAIKGSVKSLRFSGGDDWSKGAVEYRDITLIK
jgi:hypothetical protein